MPRSSDPENWIPLTPAVFYILLALADQDRHGYAIMQQILADTGGLFRMGPGTLYGSIKRMLSDNLIAETGVRPAPEDDDVRRRYYCITEKGRDVMEAEASRMERALRVARRRRVMRSRQKSTESA